MDTGTVIISEDDSLLRSLELLLLKMFLEDRALILACLFKLPAKYEYPDTEAGPVKIMSSTS